MSSRSQESTPAATPAATASTGDGHAGRPARPSRPRERRQDGQERALRADLVKLARRVEELACRARILAEVLDTDNVPTRATVAHRLASDASDVASDALAAQRGSSS